MFPFDTVNSWSPGPSYWPFRLLTGSLLVLLEACYRAILDVARGALVLGQAITTIRTADLAFVARHATVPIPCAQ